MEPNETLPTIASRAGVKITAEQAQQFEQLKKLMTSDPLYSSVSKIPEWEIDQKHFLDSLIPLSFDLQIWEKAKALLDLGTGGGFPALPLAIIFPEKKIFAVDARSKSVDFVGRMAEALGLKNLLPVQGRAEELGCQAQFREKFDIVVSRAVAELRILLEYCIPLVRVGGHGLFYKGPKLEEEISTASKAFLNLDLESSRMQIFHVEPPKVPFSRGFIVIEKTRPTRADLPRRNGVPSSKPL